MTIHIASIARRPRNPSLAPELYPDRFCMRADGTCCQPEIMDGQYLLVDKTRRFERGDFVTMFRDPETVEPGDHVLKVKRLVHDLGSYMVVATLNPPQLLMVDKAQVKAVWFTQPAPQGFLPGPRVSDAALLAQNAPQALHGVGGSL